jgi:hypothetical protein
MNNFCFLLAFAFYGINVPDSDNILPPCLRFGQSLPRLNAHQAWLQDTMLQNSRYQQLLKQAVKEQELNQTDFLILQVIANTESNGRHYKNGKLLRGYENYSAVGLFQIDERFHKKEALLLGHDIYTPKGNINYAVELYQKEGVKPWRTNEKFMKFYARLIAAFS